VPAPTIVEDFKVFEDGVGQFHIRKVHGAPPSGGPLTYPDPNAEFYGYERQRTWYPEGISSGTKETVDLAVACAAPFAAKLSGQLINGKARAVELYRDCQDKPFSDFVPRLYTRCKEDWRFRIPDAEAERKELRRFCEMLLALENHVLDEFGND
jgi:hypothetical protein